MLTPAEDATAENNYFVLSTLALDTSGSCDNYQLTGDTDVKEFCLKLITGTSSGFSRKLRCKKGAWGI